MENESKKLTGQFGTIGGVLTPNILTILGVILYLRLGWVVGNAGLYGAIAIILLANSVTFCTGLSMSSITTNINIGAGGAYSIITKSLGVEAGGSIGIPFYISQTLSASLYIIGFTEGWIMIFPHHIPIVVSLITWALLLSISYLSTKFAIKIQYILLVVIGLSLISFAAIQHDTLLEPTIRGNYTDASFWAIFAIFFPAVTGIMAGANMSGELKDPKKSIPKGTLYSIGITLIVYLGVAVIMANFIPAHELRDTKIMVMVKYAFNGQIVLAAILAATFSSALGSMVGAPRVLQALAEQKTIPMHQTFAATRENGEPYAAIIITGLIIILAIFLGDLNALATIITMFFLITYGTLNMVVFTHKILKIPSFRPTFKTPLWVSLYGALSCLAIMFLINIWFSIMALITIGYLYIFLSKKNLENSTGDLRGGIFIFLAEKTSKWAEKFPKHHITWKPDLLIPIKEPKEWDPHLALIDSIIRPSGSVFAFTIQPQHTGDQDAYMDELFQSLREKKLLVHSTVLEHEDFVRGSKLVIQTLKGRTIHPNTLFLTLGEHNQAESKIHKMFFLAKRYQMGRILFFNNKRANLGIKKDVNIWLRDESPNWHLAILIALQIHSNWQGQLNLITASPDPNDRDRLTQYLEHFRGEARLPIETQLHVYTGDFMDVLKQVPKADINIYGMAEQVSFDFFRSIAETVGSSCLFIADSGKENALI